MSMLLRPHCHTATSVEVVPVKGSKGALQQLSIVGDLREANRSTSTRPVDADALAINLHREIQSGLVGE